MKKCFGYVRISTIKQGEGVSLEAQRDAILFFAERNNLTITKWFEEKETAAKIGRTVFASMLKELHRHSADGVVMHKIDRSARNLRDWVSIGELSDIGIDVHFATESLDFRSRGGRLTADIQAVIAADYIRNLREETIKGITGRLKQGLYPFKAPIGYLDMGRGQPKAIDPVRGSLVKRAFELYASGRHSIRSLQAEMRHLGLVTESGKPVSKGGIEKMLSNPFYTGVIRIRRTGATYRGIHKPLISANTFKTVQTTKAGKAGKKVTRHNHTYRGLFRCKGCGFSMIPEKQKGYVYYRCQTRSCPANCIREEGLEGAVVAVLNSVALPEYAIRAVTEAVEKWVAKHPRATERQTFVLQLQNIESRIDRLTDALIERLIDDETFNRRKESLLLEQAELQNGIDSLKQQNASPQMVQKFLERIKNLAEHYTFADSDERRAIAEMATSNRTVQNKNVYLEPSNWLKVTEESLAAFCGDLPRPNARRPRKLQMREMAASCDLPRPNARRPRKLQMREMAASCDPSRPNARRHPKLSDEQIEKLFKIVRSDEVDKLYSI